MSRKKTWVPGEPLPPIAYYLDHRDLNVYPVHGARWSKTHPLLIVFDDMVPGTPGVTQDRFHATYADAWDAQLTALAAEKRRLLKLADEAQARLDEAREEAPAQDETVTIAGHELRRLRHKSAEGHRYVCRSGGFSLGFKNFAEAAHWARTTP